MSSLSDACSYAYDDLVGLHTCPAGTVIYEVEFSPPGSPAYPHRLTQNVAHGSSLLAEPAEQVAADTQTAAARAWET